MRIAEVKSNPPAQLHRLVNGICPYLIRVHSRDSREIFRLVPTEIAQRKDCTATAMIIASPEESSVPMSTYSAKPRFSSSLKRVKPFAASVKPTAPYCPLSTKK